MRKMSYVKLSVITAACIALCVVFPMVFHAIPQAGFMLLPMHIPVLLCGLIAGWRFGLLCGMAGPLLSHLLTGMPGPVWLPSMIVELGAFGLIAGLLIDLLKTKNIYVDLYISLAGAMLIGRVIAGISQALIFSRGEYSIAMWTGAYFVASFPGMIIQLAFLPSLVIALEAGRLIPKKYP